MRPALGALLPSLPLLVKDLTELGARRRTYLVRAGYAVLLFVGFLAFYNEAAERLSTAGRGWGVLGSGEALMTTVFGLQMAGTYLFLPAMMAGAIAGEKEKGTLAILFTTDLAPREILLQKYLGRMVPMFTFFLLSLPLMSVAYSMGGVSLGRLVALMAILALTALQVGAIVLIFSCREPTTERALVRGYLWLFLLQVIVMPLATGIAALLTFPFLGGFGGLLVAGSSPVWVGLALNAGPGAALALPAVVSLAWTAVFLRAARKDLLAHAFTDKIVPDLWHMRRFGYYSSDRRGKSRGYVPPWKANRPLPELAPVAWRALRTSNIKSAREFFPAALAGMGLVLLFVVATDAHDRHEMLRALLVTAFSVAAVFSLFGCARIVPDEKTRQSLDVLLATPVTSGGIVRQKLAPLAWSIGAILPSILLALALKTAASWTEEGGFAEPGRWAFMHFVAWPTTIALYVALAALVGLWAGALTGNRSRAYVVSLVVAAAWCVVPPVVLGALGRAYSESALSLASPVAIVGVLAGDAPEHVNPLRWWAANTLLYGGIAAFLSRPLWGGGADRLLGRPTARRLARVLPAGAAEGEGA